MRTRVWQLLAVAGLLAGCTSSHAQPAATAAHRPAHPPPRTGRPGGPKPVMQNDTVAGKGGRVGLLVPAGAGRAAIADLLRGCHAQNLVCVLRRPAAAHAVTAGRELVADGVRVLVVVDANFSTAGRIERYAYANGVRSVDYGQLVRGGTASVFVGAGGGDSARTEARALAHCPQVPRHGRVGYVRLGPALGAVQLGATSGLPRRWHLAAARTGTSARSARAALRAAPHARAVLATNDAAAVAAVTALHHRRVAVAGQGVTAGALQRILAGTQCVTVAPATSEQAAAALRAVVRMVNFRPITASSSIRRTNGHRTPAIIVHGARPVTRAQVKSVLAAGYVARSAVCTPAFAKLCARAGI